MFLGHFPKSRFRHHLAAAASPALKRALIVFLSFVFLLSPCSSFAVGQSYIPDVCGNVPCTCFVQLLDHGEFVSRIIDLLKTRGYLYNFENIGQFTEKVQIAVLRFQKDNDLPLTGTMDDDTLTLLIWGMTPEELDVAQPDSDPETVYVPTDGGRKRHNNPQCSEMYDPRKVSARNADKLGYDRCSKCWLHSSDQPITDDSTDSGFSAFVADVSQITRSSPPADQQQTPIQQTYIINKKSKVFHLPTCLGVQSMKDSNKISLDGTREELIAMGYHPCGNCKP